MQARLTAWQQCRRSCRTSTALHWNNCDIQNSNWPSTTLRVGNPANDTVGVQQEPGILQVEFTLYRLILQIRSQKRENSTENTLYMAVSFKSTLPIYEEDVFFSCCWNSQNFLQLPLPKGYFIARLATPGTQMYTVVNPTMRFEAGFICSFSGSVSVRPEIHVTPPPPQPSERYHFNKQIDVYKKYRPHLVQWFEWKTGLDLVIKGVPLRL